MRSLRRPSRPFEDGVVQRASTSRFQRQLFRPLLLSLLASSGLGACAHQPPRPEAIEVGASRSLSLAREEQRRALPGWRERARAAAESALASEPGWVAPGRFLDDLLRAEGLGHWALAQRQAQLAEAKERSAAPAELARLAYLIGRFEGSAGVPRFEVARRIDPSLSWARHGIAWMTFTAGDARGALEPGELAIAAARDPWEAATFTVALARYLLELGETEEATQRLAELLEETPLEPADRLMVELWLARAELESAEPVPFGQGFWRGIRLLAEHDLASDELVPLVRSMQRAARQGGSGELLEGSTNGLLEELELALAARSSATRLRLRAGILADRGEPSFVLELERGRSPGPGQGAPRRAALLAQGRAREVLADWLAALPAVVLDSEGMPLRPELSELVRVSRKEELDPAEFAGALLEAGWFREARGWAAWMANSDVAQALEVDSRALAGRATIETIRRILDGIDRGSGVQEIGGRISNLTQLLDQLEMAFSRVTVGANSKGAFGPFGEQGTGDLGASPRTGVAPIAEVVHPGPFFSTADEAAGLGRAGARVPGLASRLADLGRFGIFGYAIGGGGPDGSVLRLLGTEQRKGSHLGVPYAGTVAWCEGVDVPSRPARQGARIVGAALHEGYWIDIEGVREELELWRALEARFAGPSGLHRARFLLAAEGPSPRGAALLSGHDPARSEFISSERWRPYAPQREADRVRLAVLLDRSTSDSELETGLVQLEELLEVTAAHEEGHLTERTRFLPALSHPLRWIGALLESGFSPWRISLRLEYRAQLIAMAVVRDPRIVLAECIDALEGGGTKTPHAEAFGELLTDWLEVLSERIEEFPGLDPGRYLIHQVHHLGPEEVRRIALILAARRDLIGLDS